MNVKTQDPLLWGHTLQKDITFNNSTGTVSVFTVRGDVVIQILPVVTTDLVPNTSANIRLGVVGNTAAIIVDSDADDLDAYGIWVDQTPDNEIEPLDRIRSYFVSNSHDVVLTLSAQIDSGAITFYCGWSPFSSNGLVVVA